MFIYCHTTLTSYPRSSTQLVETTTAGKEAGSRSERQYRATKDLKEAACLTRTLKTLKVRLSPPATQIPPQNSTPALIKNYEAYKGSRLLNISLKATNYEVNQNGSFLKDVEEFAKGADLTPRTRRNHSRLLLTLFHSRCTDSTTICNLAGFLFYKPQALRNTIHWVMRKHFMFSSYKRENVFQSSLLILYTFSNNQQKGRTSAPAPKFL